MPFCPECQAEYEDDVTTCTDCGVALVATLPAAESGDSSDAEMVSFMNFSNAATASLVKNLFEENDIRAFVSGGDFTVVPSGFLGEIVLMVDERDLDRANTLYEAYFGAESTEMAPSQLPEDIEDNEPA
ncbi:MAG TPA: DUF2007 domain-containing protein [Blastocatellia bacterium]|nr:DUF2007 domain-containing protein [Blastocatellia bacterium]